MPDRPPPHDAPPAAFDADVLIIGGGPAGSTAAMRLARDGRRVVLLEKAHHPRFHIGESLLPANAALFDALGLRDEVERIGMPKWGVEFVSPDHAHTSTLSFGDQWDKSQPYAWQVRRSELDERMFRRAQADGAMALEGWCVRDVAFDDDGATVEARADDGAVRRWRVRFVLDASGRDTFLATRQRTKAKNPRHDSAALFVHYRGARRLEGRDEGNISIFWFAHGWFWFIPLADGTTSVGAVCWPHYLKRRQGRPLAEFWAETVALAPRLAQRLQDAQIVDGVVHATGNYSYTAQRSHGPRHLLLGDAYAFIDPVFSSGVYFAMVSAFEAARAVGVALDRPAEAARAFAAYDKVMRKGPREFSWFIYRVTNPTMRALFMQPANPLRMKEALLSTLAGDIHRGTPIGPSLAAFKAVYYLMSLAHLPRTLRAWRARRRNVRDLGPLDGETVMVDA